MLIFTRMNVQLKLSYTLECLSNGAVNSLLLLTVLRGEILDLSDDMHLCVSSPKSLRTFTKCFQKIY